MSLSGWVAVHRFDLADLAPVVLQVERVHRNPAPAVQLAEAPVGVQRIQPLVALNLATSVS